jgi:hypothetical protein
MNEYRDHRDWAVDRLAAASGLEEEEVLECLERGEIQGSSTGQGWLVDDAEARHWLASRGIITEEQADRAEPM